MRCERIALPAELHPLETVIVSGEELYRIFLLLKRGKIGVCRKDDPEFGSDIAPVVRLNLSSVVGDDAVDDGKTQACSTFFGCVKWIEDVRKDLGRDAAPGISNLN